MTTMAAPMADPRVQTALLGEKRLRPLQEKALARMREGRNFMAVFGTGQGKSVIFQIPAAELALAGRKTLIFHPLRALANDQLAMMNKAFEKLPGIRMLRANGSMSKEERERLDTALLDGSWDIILATPEFATHHADRFAMEANRPALVVLDEAHHLQESRHRPAYRAFADLLARLGNPQTAAFTATARDEAFDHMVATLGIESWIINPATRENLRIVDSRNERNKFQYLWDLAEQNDGKTIVYCNSRKETVRLAGMLAENHDGVTCYNAEMPTPKRSAVEDDFRAGRTRFVVATSAFGEGIDLADVRNVVMYHLNFDMVSFNQMAGRAGRDGRHADIHLLYGDRDRSINDFIIGKSNPTIAVLRDIYVEMRERGGESGEIRSTYVDVARAMGRQDVDGATISAAARMFADVGLAQIGKDEEGRFIRMIPPTGPVDIEGSTRYEESMAEIAAFDRFCRIAMGASAKELERQISRPIYPANVELER